MCCAVLCGAVRCRAVLCGAVLCCAVLCYAVLCCAVRCCAARCCAALCCPGMRCAVLCCAGMRCAVPRYTVLCWATTFCSASCYLHHGMENTEVYASHSWTYACSSTYCLLKSALNPAPCNAVNSAGCCMYSRNLYSTWQALHDLSPQHQPTTLRISVQSP